MHILELTITYSLTQSKNVPFSPSLIPSHPLFLLHSPFLPTKCILWIFPLASYIYIYIVFITTLVKSSHIRNDEKMKENKVNSTTNKHKIHSIDGLGCPQNNRSFTLVSMALIFQWMHITWIVPTPILLVLLNSCCYLRSNCSRLLNLVTPNGNKTHTFDSRLQMKGVTFVDPYRIIRFDFSNTFQIFSNSDELLLGQLL